MGTKNNPAPFDCYTNAEPDEPMFILLARDESAPGLVREWVYRRNIRKGLSTTGARDEKAREALACADAMEAWRGTRVSRECLHSETARGCGHEECADPENWLK